MTRRTFVSTAPTGSWKAIEATARAVYGPTPGSRSRAGIVLGKTPWSSPDDDPGGSLEVDRPAVVAQPLPGPQDGRRACLGQRLERRELRREPDPGRAAARDLGLLEDRLGDEHEVRIGRAPERERPTASLEPGQNRLPEGFDVKAGQELDRRRTVGSSHRVRVTVLLGPWLLPPGTAGSARGQRFGRGRVRASRAEPRPALGRRTKRARDPDRGTARGETRPAPLPRSTRGATLRKPRPGRYR